MGKRRIQHDTGKTLEQRQASAEQRDKEIRKEQAMQTLKMLMQIAELKKKREKSMTWTNTPRLDTPWRV
jgi:hypothetical protein